MPYGRLPKKVFYGELQEGKRSQGGQRKRYKDTIKASLKDFDIPIGSCEQTDCTGAIKVIIIIIIIPLFREDYILNRNN